VGLADGVAFAEVRIEASGETPPPPGEVAGGSAATEPRAGATGVLGREAPQEANATTRSIARAVTPAAPFVRRAPVIGGL
jgi:hypothetical protein